MSSRSGILRIPRAPHERPIPRNLESSLLIHYKPYDPSTRPPDRFFIEMGLGMKQLAGCMADKKTDEEDLKNDEDEEHEEDEEKDQANEEEEAWYLDANAYSKKSNSDNDVLTDSISSK